MQLHDFNRRVASIRLRALRLLDLQLWCLGCDVRCSTNWLKVYGFVQHRLPQGRPGSPEYVWQQDPDHRLSVWGYGMHWASRAEAGLFLRRHAFAPRVTARGFAPAGLWRVEQWSKARAPRDVAEYQILLAHLVRLTRALSRYEAWLARTAPQEYRARCLHHWHKESLVPADQISQAWEELGDHFASSISIRTSPQTAIT
jgi:hypothetical protein